jgi:hypothetical protein
MLRSFEEERHERENMLRSALNEAKAVHRRVREAERQMKQADHQVGKARFIIRKSGFGQILHSSTCKTPPLVLEIWSLEYVLFHPLLYPHFSIHPQMSTSYIYKEEV